MPFQCEHQQWIPVGTISFKKRELLINARETTSENLGLTSYYLTRARERYTEAKGDDFANENALRSWCTWLYTDYPSLEANCLLISR